MRIEPVRVLETDIPFTAAPDKSITHRAVMFNAAADSGSAVISNALLGADCISTIECMRALGAEITVAGDTVTVIKPVDPARLKGKTAGLYVGNSGTTIRLMSGLLAGLKISAVLTGDESIMKRPMERVAAPLRLLGADIKTNGGRAPVTVSPARLTGARITISTPSAQVKSAAILAAIRAGGVTEIVETAVTRDHTELMLKSMGADITSSPLSGGGSAITVSPSEIKGTDIRVGGDISAAAYFLVLAAVIPGPGVTLKNININPTRTGILTVMKQAGCNVTLSNITEAGGEPSADITVVYTGNLKPFTISGAIVPLLIDEIPALSVLACFIKGKSVIMNAAELKVKESDRIETVVTNLKRLGADITAADDGMTVNGTGVLRGAPETIQTFGDHRIAMAMAVAALASKTGADIDDMDCCAVSFPSFLDELKKIKRQKEGTGPQKYALIGADIAYSASKKVHSAIYGAAGINAEYCVINAGMDFLPDIKENMRGFSGFNVTKPFKTAVIPYLDAIDDSAHICGAVNTVVIRDGKYIGYNTDGQGFLLAAEAAGVDFTGKTVLILGAGGAARAVIAAVFSTPGKCAHMYVYNRTKESAARLVKELRYPGLAVTDSPAAADIIINCTSAGLDGAACPLPEGFGYGGTEFCIDLIYNPAVTPFLKAAAAAKVKTLNGAAMLIFQAFEAGKLWHGDIKLTNRVLDDIIYSVQCSERTASKV